MKNTRSFGLVASLALFGCGAEDPSQALDKTPDGVRWTIPVTAAKEAQEVQNQAGGQARTNNITYHGGPVMTSGVNAYVIWYGAWAGNTGVTIVENFLASVGGSPYWNINTTYTNGVGAKVSPNVTLAKSITDNYSLGKALTDANVQTIVFNHINSGELPKDANGIYFVLTAADVNATSGFCTQYCGWHTYGTLTGTSIKYSFVGNPDRCPASCEGQVGSSPNGNPGADGMVSIIAHEAEEAATDPQLNAWYDRSGAENADKCAWTFGTTKLAGNGSKYNMTLGGLNYLIQQNWIATGTQKCALSYP